MATVGLSRSLYLDTNTFIYASFYLARPDGAPDLDYYRLGENVIQCLEHCQSQRIRVFSTALAYLEMHYNYHEWAKFKQALDAGAPPGLLFGKNKRMDTAFLRQPLTPSMQQQVLEATVEWLQTWHFNTLVEFKQPSEIPNWFQIAKCIYSRYMETVLDCLHVAAAISLECDYFLTQDRDLRRLISDMRADSAFRQILRDGCGLSSDYGLPNAVEAQTFNAPARMNG
jgi:hypothetical protein